MRENGSRKIPQWEKREKKSMKEDRREKEDMGKTASRQERERDRKTGRERHRGSGRAIVGTREGKNE